MDTGVYFILSGLSSSLIIVDNVTNLRIMLYLYPPNSPVCSIDSAPHRSGREYLILRESLQVQVY